MGLAEETDMSERREKKNKKHKEKDKELLNLEAEITKEDNGEKSKEGDRKKKKKEKRERKIEGSDLQDGDVSVEELFRKKDQMTNEHEKKRVKEQEGDSEVVSAKEEKKRKKEKRDKVMEDKGLLNLEAEGTREDKGEKSKEGDKKKKKKEKRERKIEGSDLQDGDVSGKELSMKNDQMTNEHEKKRVNENQGDAEVVSAEEEKKRKKEKRNKLMEDGISYDRGEELSGKKDQMANKHEKKHVKEREDDSEVVSAKEEKKRKKEKRNKVVEDGETYDIGEETPSGKIHIERQVTKSLDLSKVEKKSDHEIDLEDTKRKRKEKKSKCKEGVTDSLSKTQNCKQAGKSIETEPESIEEQDSVDAEPEVDYTTNREKKKSKKKKDKIDDNVDSLLPNNASENFIKDKKRKNVTEDEEKRNTLAHVEGGNKIDTSSSKKRKENKCKNVIEDHSREVLETPVDQEKKKSTKKKDKIDSNVDSILPNKSGENTTKEKKRKSITGDEEERNTLVHIEGSNNIDTRSSKKRKKKNKRKNDIEDNSKEILETPVDTGKTETKKPSKRVKFSGKVEVFPLSDAGDVRKENQEGGLVRGKRFSKDEDEIIKNAVFDYIKEHGLGDDGLHKVLHCKDFPETKNCWKEISAAIPWRPLNGIYSRAHILFERAEKREWTAEDLEFIKEFYEKHGSDWRALGDEMKRSRIHVKDTWRRRVSLPNRKLGPWSQEEYQTLFDLVNMDLRMKVYEEKKSKHGMLIDNIAWDAISKRLSTRSNDVCCRKWYGQLESPLVREGKWASSDDFRLLTELADKDYSSVEEVDWDNILEHRPGDICRKRWYQMANHLGNGCKEFADQLVVLLKRYCPELLETREILESKTPIDI